jgi:hypothetical protein
MCRSVCVCVWGGGGGREGGRGDAPRPCLAHGDVTAGPASPNQHHPRLSPLLSTLLGCAPQHIRPHSGRTRTRRGSKVNNLVQTPAHPHPAATAGPYITAHLEARPPEAPPAAPCCGGVGGCPSQHTPAYTLLYSAPTTAGHRGEVVNDKQVWCTLRHASCSAHVREHTGRDKRGTQLQTRARGAAQTRQGRPANTHTTTVTHKRTRGKYSHTHAHPGCKQGPTLSSRRVSTLLQAAPRTNTHTWQSGLTMYLQHTR